MDIIPQMNLFSWQEIQSLGDLERLRLVLEYMPDEELMQTLEQKRGKGRDDYPVRAMWNSLLAGIVFQHESVEKLRRELARNGQLRQMCGLDDQIPSPWAYARFLKTLMKHEALVETVFYRLVDQIRAALPDFGKQLAIDSKAISSFAKRRNRKEAPDGRRDTDADDGKKTYHGVKENGTLWEKVVTWFGYKLHLIVDAVYELPVHFRVTKASASDVRQAHQMLEEMEQKQPDILSEADTLAGDKAYDDKKLIMRLWDEYGIKPVIDIRRVWKDGEPTRLLSGKENVVYNDQGQVYCIWPETGTEREMACGGFEKDRNTLKKLCPAKQYGIVCKGLAQCPAAKGVRIRLSEDCRIFTPIDRASYKWERVCSTDSCGESVQPAGRILWL
jgi:hypothetical protein